MALPEFRNEPFTDFTSEPGRSAMLAAIKKVEAELGKELPLVIGGRRVTTKDKFTSMDPSQKDRVVATCQKATPDHVQQAVAAADEAFKTWSRVPAEERAAILLRAADRLRRR
ncbi:MAG TPA: aldehyde dehydrogenase family protein, partial [Gemmatimonadales bacterium]|nr:aldehyde dehydrogenase family protein [Gemmatimonadales bacterium]